eukprot:scaffold79714_cov24-Phaeocystis_antarctica.AAC.1
MRRLASRSCGRTRNRTGVRTPKVHRCFLEMQRRPSKIFELPAQPATSALDRRFSELFSPGAADDIEEAIPPFCRRTCGC